MATSSITKQFIVKDEQAFERLVEEINKKPQKNKRAVKPSNIERGLLLLEQFSFPSKI